MRPIDDIVRTGGTIDVPGGFLKREFELGFDGSTVARLAWEHATPGPAFLDTADARFEITVPERSHRSRRRTVQVHRAGEVLAELRVGWRGTTGEAMTSRGRRFTFRTTRGNLVLDRDAGHDEVLTVSNRRLLRGRRIKICPCGLELDETVALIAAVAFHVLACDYANDRNAMIAGGALGGR